MPRVEALGNNIKEHCRKTGDGSQTHDVCRHCYDRLVSDPHFYDEELEISGEPKPEDGWGGEVVHPNYEENDYQCAVCTKQLDEDDD